MKPPITERPDDSWLDAQHFENRRNFPPEELDKYAGQYVAWSWEGSRILGRFPIPVRSAIVNPSPAA